MGLRADASGDFANRTAGGFPTPSAMTVCFWIYREAAFDSGSTWWGMGGPTNSPEYYITFYNAAGDGTTFIWEEFGGDTVGSFSVTQDTWFFVALSIAGIGANQTVAHRRAANAAALTSNTATFPNAGTAITSGEIVFANPYNTALAAKGRIAAMKIWSAALSADEVLAESYRQTPVRFANLHSWRPFIHGNVTDALRDYSGNGRDLTPNGSLLIADGPPVGWTRSKRIYIPSAVAALTIAPNVIASAESVPSPALAVTPIPIAPAAIPSGEAFFSPSLAVVPAPIAPAAIPSGETFFAPTLSAGALAIAPNAIPSGETFFNPTIAGGAVAIAPDAIPSAEQFFLAAVGGGRKFKFTARITDRLLKRGIITDRLLKRATITDRPQS